MDVDIGDRLGSSRSSIRSTRGSQGSDLDDILRSSGADGAHTTDVGGPIRIGSGPRPLRGAKFRRIELQPGLGRSPISIDILSRFLELPCRTHLAPRPPRCLRASLCLRVCAAREPAVAREPLSTGRGGDAEFSSRGGLCGLRVAIRRPPGAGCGVGRCAEPLARCCVGGKMRSLPRPMGKAMWNIDCPTPRRCTSIVDIRRSGRTSVFVSAFVIRRRLWSRSASLPSMLSHLFKTSIFFGEPQNTECKNSKIVGEGSPGVPCRLDLFSSKSMRRDPYSQPFRPHASLSCGFLPKPMLKTAQRWDLQGCQIGAIVNYVDPSRWRNQRP